MRYPDNAQSAAGVELARIGYTSWEQIRDAIGPKTILATHERNRIAKLMVVADPAKRGEVLKLNPGLFN